jgi:glycosyltransferase involved in cell wall biosynthesis
MKISVYITSYNQKRYVGEAIDSVLAQTLSPSQVIIIDDCSTDGSQELIAGYASRHRGLITAVYHSQNLGVAQTRIDALGVVSGDFVTYVDGDDRFLPTKLEKEARLVCEKPENAIAFSNNYYMSAAGVRIGVWADHVTPPCGDVFRETFARTFPRNSLFRMELINYHAWKSVGFHDPCLRLYEDFDMRIRLTKICRAVYCDEPLSEIRVHKSGLSSAPATEHLEAVKYIYRKNKHLLLDLDARERRGVQQRLGQWMAGFARKASRQALRNKGYDPMKLARAFKYRLLNLKYTCGRIGS